MKKVWSVFIRDCKIAKSDPLALWIIAAPLICAVVVNLLSPGVNDSSVKFAVDHTVAKEYISEVENFAKVERFESRAEVEERVLRRDEVLGVTMEGDEMKLISQGNESENSLKFGRIINALYHLDLLDLDKIHSRLTFFSFNEKIPALKRTLSVSLLLLNTIVSAMMIVLGLVDEKNDKTIRAANVTPMNPVSYVLSKSIIGIALLLVSSVVILFILGITDIVWGKIMVMILTTALLSVIVSFVIGLSSTDFIEAAASLKMLMVPMLAGILVYELLNEKWYFTVYWDPFYWADKGMTEIINKTATWGDTLLYALIITALCGIVFLICKKNIKNHLN